MLKLSEQLNNIPVISYRSGHRIATAISPIINPHNLKILGWWCDSKTSDHPMVLLVDNTRDLTNFGLAVDDHNDLSDPEDLVRLKEILEIDYQLVGKTVKTKSKKVGKVADFSYSNQNYVQKLYVSRPLIRAFSTDTAIIDRSQILEISDHYIIVKDTELKLNSPARATRLEQTAATLAN